MIQLDSTLLDRDRALIEFTDGSESSEVSRPHFERPIWIPSLFACLRHDSQSFGGDRARESVRRIRRDPRILLDMHEGKGGANSSKFPLG
jgi:hypothetical protein